MGDLKVHGSACIHGGKDYLQPLLPFYIGTRLVQESGGNVISTARSYRV